MLHADWKSRAWLPVLRDRSTDARLRLLPRLAGAALALLLSLAFGAGALTWSSLSRLEREHYPALREGRELGLLLTAARDALEGRDAGAPGSRLARADSLASRFERLAADAQRRESVRESMRAAEQLFYGYYLEARRATAQRISAGEVAPAPIVDPSAAHRRLRQLLDSTDRALQIELDDELASVRRLQAICWVVLALVSAGVIVLLASLGTGASRSAAEPVAELAHLADAIAQGKLDVPLQVEGDDVRAEAHRALARIAGTLRANEATAEALTTGDYRRDPMKQIPRDRTGRALARLAAYLDGTAEQMYRIAEGDLTARVEPRSEGDTFGHACAAMTRRLAHVLGELEATTRAVAEQAEQTRRLALDLASGTAQDAEDARRTAEGLAVLSADLRGDAGRAAALEGHAAGSAATVQEGSAALHESVQTLQRLLARAPVVERIASDAQLLSFNAAIEAARAGEEGRGLVVIAEELQRLAEDAGAAAREISALAGEGADTAARSTRILARLGPGVDDGVAQVRELGASSRQHAAAAQTVERATVVVASRTAGSAAAATDLADAADELSSMAERLGALLRSFQRGETPRTGPQLVRGPVLHRTPAFTLPALAMG